MRSSRWSLAAVAAFIFVVHGVTAEAQVCGDADNSGTVTVTDGVQALRAAAGLASSCDTNSNCDFDGSGSVSVADGVNILRKAAELPVTEACVVGTNSAVASLLKQSIPIFGGFGQLTKIGAGGGAQAAAEPCENSDGSATFDEVNNEFDFDNCRFEGVTLDGFIAVDGNTFFLDLEITDDAGGDIEFFTDTGLIFEESGDNVILTGQLGLTDFSGDLGDFSATLEGLVTDPSGNLIGGSLLFDASESDIEGLAQIRVGFNGTSTIQPVDLILTDQSVQHFNFDSVSGTLTPASS